MPAILSLVASFVLLADSQAQSKSELRVQRPAWSKVSASLAVLKDSHGAGTGFAVLVGKDGTFIASRSAVQSKSVSATLSGPEEVRLDVIAEDPVTNLAWLKASQWDATKHEPVAVVDREIGTDEILLAASASGPISGQMTNNRRPGVLANSQFVPFFEMRIEATTDLIGGAVVFTQSGELVGVLSATQGNVSTQFGATAGRGAGSPAGLGGGGFGGGGGKPEAPGKAQPANVPSGGAPSKPVTVSPEAYQKLLSNYGPQGLTVGYVLGPKVLKRVINGFASEDHKVKHPYIGVEFREVVKGKVMLTLVKKGGAAEKAGLLNGDYILKVDNVAVQSSVHFASLLFEQEPGGVMKLSILRGAVVQTIDVPVGVQPAGR